MAIFHLDFKIVKRSEGKSSVAKAAYHARCRITDERTGDTYDYSRRTDLCGHFILAPVNAPQHIVKDSTALWNEVERVERQNNGQTARYFDVAIPTELNNDDKKKLVLEYCQKNFVDKSMIADIAFHDLDSDNPHAHVMLTLKTIGPEGFGKKERSWNDRKMSVLWRESWASMANSFLAAAGSSERIDHRSLQAQHEEALEKAAVALDNEEKALWLAKSAETNRPSMKRIHSAKWRSKAAQEQRAAEQAVRDAAKQEAVEVYKTFSELDLEIVVDVRSFTVAVLAEPEEIVLPESRTCSLNAEELKPVLVAPAPHTRARGVKSYRDKTKISKVVAAKKPYVSISDSGTNTLLKTTSSKTPKRPSRIAPEHVKRIQATPRQDNIFKRFTALLVDFIRDKFIWAKTNKTKVDIISEEHDKRIAENYVFDEVLGRRVSRSEYEKQAKFNHDDYKPTPDEISRFPSRINSVKSVSDYDNGTSPSLPLELIKGVNFLKLKPSSSNIIKNK
ncbi:MULTISPECIES: MobQ family relaxase [Photorhabdus]|uniref:Photorhabdus luminescens subsp. laumondii TTO1 complete genome segment 7/17 n=1 Tax=Photorhabdus laumondii subsp. laumondii (strain DSM 15139 / CIP 105565 / TT01) TaxID=243265 RepID=Q7N5V4_PHOLL|nr:MULTISPECIES: MobQ family relaxase [Photorhabdus]AWK41650.1 molybdopterin-guanine dinucleotide biosynthesis protein MobA [Photorhabdus laumondii subsp. laumondii]AXG42486.1 molybdopterin-guanine dinucleotide biosynthesis protein MobA [Photorhabdus laumondii subsp. laumondii]AXG46973.1 molybdopterin-guanine dinucleotide biosynthesis protein MobA [Photorhabdus laumondii subsp. laumondii]MCC8390531.1 MobA/MobL family protein [Photorhabdus laumondii]MCZ1248683.1 molybdopterin-guanine dinucleoti